MRTLGEPKTMYSRRNIALTVVGIAALATHYERQQVASTHYKGWDNPLNLLFPNLYDGIMIPHNIAKRSFKEHLSHAGLPRSNRFHDLRHTAAILLIAAGVSVKAVSEMLGHSSVTVCMYAHVLPHMQQLAVSAMDTLLAPREPRKIDRTLGHQWPEHAGRGINALGAPAFQGREVPHAVRRLL